MSFLYPVTNPIKMWPNANGGPLDLGYIYFGVANQNPESHPIQMYWDSAGLIPAAQPLRTAGGFITRQGTPANIYATGDFSVTVRAADGTLIFTSLSSVDLQLALAITGTGAASAIPLVDAGAYYSPDNVESAFQQLGPLIAQMVTALAGVIPTGARIGYVGATVPSGWVFGSGQTIGNGSSGALSATHQRANADTSALFNLLWESYTNTELVIQDSAGTPTTRGASASIDFAANRRMPTPDYRGRVGVGLDAVGTSTTIGRITNAESGIVGTTRGASGGSQSHALTTAQLAVHTHAVTDPGHFHVFQIVQASNAVSAGASSAYTSTTSANTSTQATGITNQNAGSGSTHQNTQPTIIETVIIKL